MDKIEYSDLNRTNKGKPIYMVTEDRRVLKLEYRGRIVESGKYRFEYRPEHKKEDLVVLREDIQKYNFFFSRNCAHRYNAKQKKIKE